MLKADSLFSVLNARVGGITCSHRVIKIYIFSFTSILLLFQDNLHLKHVAPWV